jgi:hypothetical protein
MNTIKIPESKFQFDKFASRILEMLKAGSEDWNRMLEEEKSHNRLGKLDESILSPFIAGHLSNLIRCVDEDGGFDPCCNRYTDDPNKFLEELECSEPLYFPFTFLRIKDDLINCADGEVRKRRNVNVKYKGEDGFLVKKEKGYFIIDSAILKNEHFYVSDCGELDKPMEDFIRRFMTTD